MKLRLIQPEASWSTNVNSQHGRTTIFMFYKLTPIKYDCLKQQAFEVKL